MGTALNHPKKGDRIKVEPIRSKEGIDAIKALLANNPRDLAIFTLGVNSTLRPSDLLQIRVGMVRSLRPGNIFEINGKAITVNQCVMSSIDKLLCAMSDVKDNDYLFQSKKHKDNPLNVSSLHRLVKTWCADTGLSGNYGSHSLRKSFGYIHRVAFKYDVAKLSVMFNHAYKRQTLNYLCLPSDELNSVCLQEI